MKAKRLPYLAEVYANMRSYKYLCRRSGKVCDCGVLQNAVKTRGLIA